MYKLAENLEKCIKFDYRYIYKPMCTSEGYYVQCGYLKVKGDHTNWFQIDIAIYLRLIDNFCFKISFASFWAFYNRQCLGFGDCVILSRSPGLFSPGPSRQ